MKVYKALNEANIEIPFPQRDLWVRGMPEQVEGGGIQPGPESVAGPA